jgi:hypothetical protein
VATVKIQCGCGQRYAFDVDEGARQLSSPISCPSCGADGTAAADAFLAQNSVRTAPRSEEPQPMTSPPFARAGNVMSRKNPRRNDDEVRDLIEAKLNVKRAVSVAVILAAIHSILGLLSLFGYSFLGANAFTLLNAGIILALGYGIHRFSRTCTVMLALYYLTDSLYAWLSSGQVGGIIIFMLLLYYFGRGAQGTFTYHRLNKN